MGLKASADVWWIIIGAVMALIALVVLLVIFTEKGRDINLGLVECKSKGGECVPQESCKGVVSSTFTCGTNEDCCFQERSGLG